MRTTIVGLVASAAVFGCGKGGSGGGAAAPAGFEIVKQEVSCDPSSGDGHATIAVKRPYKAADPNDKHASLPKDGYAFAVIRNGSQWVELESARFTGEAAELRVPLAKVKRTPAGYPIEIWMAESFAVVKDGNDKAAVRQKLVLAAEPKTVVGKDGFCIVGRACKGLFIDARATLSLFGDDCMALDHVMVGATKIALAGDTINKDAVIGCAGTYDPNKLTAGAEELPVAVKLPFADKPATVDVKLAAGRCLGAALSAVEKGPVALAGETGTPQRAAAVLVRAWDDGDFTMLGVGADVPMAQVGLVAIDRPIEAKLPCRYTDGNVKIRREIGSDLKVYDRKTGELVGAKKFAAPKGKCASSVVTSSSTGYTDARGGDMYARTPKDELVAFVQTLAK